MSIRFHKGYWTLFVPNGQALMSFASFNDAYDMVLTCGIERRAS